MSEQPNEFTLAFDFQIAACEALGSPFSAQVLRIVAANIAAGGPWADLVSVWRGWSARELVSGATTLRLLGGLHYLVLVGRDADLAAQYPAIRPAPDLAALQHAVVAAARDHADVLETFLPSPPQTNEVRRSLCLVGGFLMVARETGLPLRCLEIGASAGLNLNWDRYRYDLGPLGAWGDVASPVTLEGEWEGAVPPFDVAAEVAERAGCDQAPIDLGDTDRALRLQAYVWADQAERLARLRGAIDLARRFPPPLVAEDAGAWALRMAPPKAGLATVLYHSVVWPYLSAGTRDDLRAAIRGAGDAARPDRPFGWLRMEAVSADPTAPMDLKLTLWPGGEERLLAQVHPHGARVVWRAV